MNAGEIFTTSVAWPLDNNQWHMSFSNFTPCDIVVECFGTTIRARTAEHAYQALKSEYPHEQRYIIAQASPAGAKREGRRCEMRPHWEGDLCVEAMVAVVQSRYDQHKLFRERLHGTLGEHPIVEVTWWNDLVWGTDSEGYGQNRLGQILMNLRTEQL